MNGDFSFKSVMNEVLGSLVASVGDIVPRAITAILVILAGLLIARVAEKIVRVLFDRFRLDAGLDRVGVSKTLMKLGLKDTPGRILSRTVYFLLVILFTQAVTRAVGLNTIADAIGAFLSYLPNLIAAFLVFLLGMIVSQFLGKTVTESARDAGIDYASLLGRIVSAFVFFVVIIMSLSQLQIDTQIIKSIVLVLLSGAAVALALSFGLGTRDVTRNIVAGFYARKLMRIGDEVEIRDQRGILASITPIQTLIERDGEIVAIPNRVFLDEIVKQ